MRKADDKCKTPGRSTGEGAGRALEKNAGSASQAGLNGRHPIPRTTPFSSPSTAFHDRIGEEPHPVTQGKIKIAAEPAVANGR
jgi:hypothetical protein